MEMCRLSPISIVWTRLWRHAWGKLTEPAHPQLECCSLAEGWVDFKLLCDRREEHKLEHGHNDKHKHNMYMQIIQKIVADVAHSQCK